MTRLSLSPPILLILPVLALFQASLHLDRVSPDEQTISADEKY